MGDRIELMSPRGNQLLTITEMRSEKGEPRDVAPGSGHVVKIRVDTELLDNKSLLLKEISQPLHS